MSTVVESLQRMRRQEEIGKLQDLLRVHDIRRKAPEPGERVLVWMGSRWYFATFDTWDPKREGEFRWIRHQDSKRDGRRFAVPTEEFPFWMPCPRRPRIVLEEQPWP